jgi:hypothetical protein
MTRTGVLRYAAVQFLALVGIAMAVYPGGSWLDPHTERYEFTGNFLSDLGATHAFNGVGNRTSSMLFLIALTSLGAALIAFAWSWRTFAHIHKRATLAGHASTVFGTLSGLAFIGIAAAPIDVALDVHNACVVAAFALLLLYVICLSIVMARNGATAAQQVINVAYVLAVLAYVALVLFGPRLGTVHAHRTQVLGQKSVVIASMLYVIAMTTSLARRPAGRVD